MDGPSPVATIVRIRMQHSNSHLFVESHYHFYCARCGNRRRHQDHLSREDDRAEVMRQRERVEWAD